MKKHLIFFISIAITISCNSQNKIDDISGVWQLNSPEIGSGYLDNYQFFKNGEFKFNLNQYDELKTIVAIKGKYSISKDSIFFKAQTIEEHTGKDRLVRSRTTSLHDSWSLIGDYKISEITLKQQETISATLEFGKNSKGQISILIDGTEYFQIIRDPEDY